MKIGKVLGDLVESGDPGAYLAKELEEGLEPITERVERLEKKIDMLIILMRKIDEKLDQVKPLTDLLLKLPLFKK